MSSFASYLKKVRQRTGLSQNSLARALGVTNTYIHLLEKGKIEAPTEKRCRQLASALTVDPDEVLEIARRERLERFAEREGWASLPTRAASASRADTDLTRQEKALLRLLRRLDPDTRKDFDGMVYMLLRHLPEEDVQESLREFMKRA